MPKADLQAALKMVFPTNLVVFQFQGEQELLLTGIQAIHSKTRVGTAAGTVVAVDANPKWPVFDLKPGGKGHTERDVAAWNPATKSVDQKAAKIIAGLNVGDKAKVNWFYDERKRAMQIQVTEKAKPKPRRQESGGGSNALKRPSRSGTIAPLFFRSDRCTSQESFAKRAAKL